MALILKREMVPWHPKYFRIYYINNSLNIDFYFPCRILKLLNQRMLENLKEKWWAQNPNKATCEDDDSDTSGGIIVLI